MIGLWHMEVEVEVGSSNILMFNFKGLITTKRYCCPATHLTLPHLFLSAQNSCHTKATYVMIGNHLWLHV